MVLQKNRREQIRTQNIPQTANIFIPTFKNVEKIISYLQVAHVQTHGVVDLTNVRYRDLEKCRNLTGTSTRENKIADEGEQLEDVEIVLPLEKDGNGVFVFRGGAEGEVITGAEEEVA